MPSKKFAVALKYAKNMHAPQLIAKGYGTTAEVIISKAQLHDVPIIKDAALANAMQKISLEGYIPIKLYEAVAEIINYLDSKA